MARVDISRHEGAREGSRLPDFDAAARKSNRDHLLAIGIALGALLFVFSSSFFSMSRVWATSATFVHGFLILPICVFLVWRKRDALLSVGFQTYKPGLAIILILSIAWFVSRLVGVQVVEHFAAVGLVPAFVLTVLGRRAATVILFPMCYLFFAVPFGEALVPWLMEFTASFTVWALKLTGIPVIRDELFFSIPVGNFEVARACSGIRYLLATVALATLYVHLTFTSLRKSLVFLGVAIVVPIVANAFRAYGIVMIAHLSDMKLAVGVDHVLYGWVFFGLVIALLFWIGNRFQDKPSEDVANERAVGIPGNRAGRWSSPFVVLLLAVACAAVGPVLAFPRAMPGENAAVASLPASAGDWHLVSTVATDWYPVFNGASVTLHGQYSDGSRTVDLAIIQYHGVRQGAEIASSANQIADADDWLTYREGETLVPIRDGTSMRVRSATLKRLGRIRHVWYWYDINGDTAVNRYGAKILEGSYLLRRAPVRSTLIAMSASESADSGQALQDLADFFENAYLDIEACIPGAPDSGCKQASELSNGL